MALVSKHHYNNPVHIDFWHPHLTTIKCVYSTLTASLYHYSNPGGWGPQGPMNPKHTPSCSQSISPEEAATICAASCWEDGSSSWTLMIVTFLLLVICETVIIQRTTLLQLLNNCLIFCPSVQSVIASAEEPWEWPLHQAITGNFVMEIS